jgi:hypothetical protein
MNSFGDYEMISGKFPDSILLIGRDVGPFAQKIKEFNNDTNIGAVDLLGNIETREFADWKFSVVKQRNDCNLNRKFHRSAIEYLYELALVMLEEREFNQLIPLAPFNRHPEFIIKLSKAIAIPLLNTDSLIAANSNWSFVTNFLHFFPSYLDFYTSPWYQNEEIEDKLDIKISKNKTYTSKFKKNVNFNSKNRIETYSVPLRKIHCASFYSSLKAVDLLGFNTLGEPFNHKLILDELEMNSYLPFSFSNRNLKAEISSFLKKIITSLKLMGIISIFFLIHKGDIIPIGCNSLPDIKIDLWINRSKGRLLPLLLKPSSKRSNLEKKIVYGYKCPFYSDVEQIVPPIPSKLATNRNLPGVVSNPGYPLFSIYGASDTLSELQKNLKIGINQIKQIMS